VAEPADPVAGAASFVAKWQQRQPEMALLQAFCPPPQRPLLNAWGALNHELICAVFDPGEAAVSRTKLAWWGEELSSAAAARHPLARALHAETGTRTLPAEHWLALVQAAIALGEVWRQSPDGRLPAAAGNEYGERLAAVESRLFDAPSLPAAVVTAVGLDALLRAPAETANVAERAAEMLAEAPLASPQNLFRAARLAFDRWQLGQLCRGSGAAGLPRPPAWRALMLAWGAARRSRIAR
jgi:hypothetical protein